MRPMHRFRAGGPAVLRGLIREQPPERYRYGAGDEPDGCADEAARLDADAEIGKGSFDLDGGCQAEKFRLLGFGL